jgi:ornithine cyclodeaminase/alanine dehydrogenase-like protein (mu-crystallin family)
VQAVGRPPQTASALLASFLARADGHRLVMGAWRVAAQLPAAIRSVRPFDAVAVWSAQPQATEKLVTHWRAEGLIAKAACDLEAGVRAADIASCATLASASVFHGA